MYSSPLLRDLIDALRCLPGVGPKSAQRAAFHLLQHDRQGALQLAECLIAAMQEIGHCQQCRTFSESSICQICANSKRDHSQLCILETPADVLAIEQATDYHGLYFVLMGRLSPLDGIGPQELRLDQLALRLDEGIVTELILATNPTMEGEATAYYISEMAKKHNIKVTRIAHGVPLGGELEYVDGGTLSHAFSGRLEI